ncbi:MAG: amino acid permease [Polyangiaceae bacterium]|jgi:amino acid transporter|nr:amino acid permease [Polyangiaceae bacterium]
MKRSVRHITASQTTRTSEHVPRSVTLLGAIGVGLGAIVGGGILILAGVAFRAAGPGAVVAFALNGFVGVLTALSFAELSSAFPESGGAYTYAKKVLSVRVAFAVGWVLWFAYIVAGVLYALGFAEYAALVVVEVWRASTQRVPSWLTSRATVLVLSLIAVGVYTVSLIRRASGAGLWATVGKVIVFAALIAAGLWVLAARPEGTVRAALTPMFPRGSLGVLQAMGFTFIAFQGFEVIAAVAGEVKNPERNLPRAMLLALGVAIVTYIALLIVIATVGVPAGDSIVSMSTKDPETVMAVAVRNYLGPVGYWAIILAAILSTLSALEANLLAASRVALTMARDRTLPTVLAQTYARRGTPVMALYATALALVVTLVMVPNVAAAGAAASLIFLISFAIAHVTNWLARRRTGANPGAFRTPFFPAVPVLGAVACVGLALFQAVAVPAAGGIVAVWLALGGILYLALFARGARIVDAYAEAAEPGLVKYRGRSPLVLMPIANPSNAPALVGVAGALAPPVVGRVLLLSVVKLQTGSRDVEASIRGAQEVLQRTLTTAIDLQYSPEALVTMSSTPWAEIARVANEHRCESLLLGINPLEEASAASHEPLQQLLNEVTCDVSILRAVPGWQLDQVRRVLVPIGGKGVHDELRARLLGSLMRAAPRQLTFMQVLPANTSEDRCAEARRMLSQLAMDEAATQPEPVVVRGDDALSLIETEATKNDLLILGLPRIDGRKILGTFALQVATRVPCATILICRRD